MSIIYAPDLKASMSGMAADNALIGYVPTINIVGYEVPANITAKLYSSTAPTYTLLAPDTNGFVKVAGLLGYFQWKGGVTDHIELVMYVNQEAMGNIKAALVGKSHIEVKVKNLSYWIAKYNSDEKKWIEHCYPKAPTQIQGQLEKRGNSGTADAYVIDVDVDPIHFPDNKNIHLHPLHLTITPGQEGTMDINYTVVDSAPVVLKWGTPVGTLAAQAMK